MKDGKYIATKEIHLTDPDWDNAVIMHISSGEAVEVKAGRVKLSDRTIPESWFNGYEDYFEKMEDSENEDCKSRI